MNLLEGYAAPELGSRALLPQLTTPAYLNHAAISPVTAPVAGAVQQVLADYSQRGVMAFGKWDQQRAGLRQNLATLIGGDAAGIALITNTTHGVQLVAQGIAWKHGDRVVVFSGEFPANTTPWQQAALQFGVELVWLAADEFRTAPDRAWARFHAELAKGVRVVAVSAVQFQTGFRMPLQLMAEATHAAGGEIFVDAIQQLGAVPLDVRQGELDYVSCGGHKHLMSLEGAGFLYVRPDRLGQLVPRWAGWLSHENPVGFLFEGTGQLTYDRAIRQSADAMEGGTCSVVGYAALDAAVQLLLALGVDRIQAHVSAYLDELEAALKKRGFTSLRSPERAFQSSLFCFLPPAGVDAKALHRGMMAASIPCGYPDGHLRFAPHFHCRVEEQATVLARLDELLAV